MRVQPPACSGAPASDARPSGRFGYPDTGDERRHWLAALSTSSVIYVALGLVALLVGTASRRFVAPQPEPVEVTFVEKLVRPVPPPVVEERPKLPPPPEVKPQPRRRAAAAPPPIPKNMKVRTLDAPPPPKELVAPKEIPHEPPKEADPSLDQGIAVVGEPAVVDAAGLEGGIGDGAGDITGTFDVPPGAVPPHPRPNNKKPYYPPSALAAHQTGVVVVRCVVRADGYVDDLEVVSGDEPFVMFVLKAVRRWRYEPALADGQPISVPHEIEVRFRLT